MITENARLPSSERNSRDNVESMQISERHSTLTPLYRCRLSRAHDAYTISPLQPSLPSIIFGLGRLNDTLRENLEGRTWLFDEGSSVGQS